MNVLLLGGAGFAGRHLADALGKDRAVFSFGREADVRNLGALRRVISESRPDQVVNFASITTVRESNADPIGTYTIALHGMQNLLTALKEVNFSGRVLNISSSEVYGHPSPEELPLTEASPLRPMSAYSVAKVASEYLCGQWWRSEGIEIVIARPFTHIGPGQSERFAIAGFARQIAEIMVGRRQPVIHVGDLTTTRDFTDVRDAVRAYASLLDVGSPGEIYNVCSGVETSVQTLLDGLIARAGCAISVETDSALLRGAEQRRLRGSYDKLAQKTRWTPEIVLEDTLNDILDYWRNELR